MLLNTENAYCFIVYSTYSHIHSNDWIVNGADLRVISLTLIKYNIYTYVKTEESETCNSSTYKEMCTGVTRYFKSLFGNIYFF